jgi:hypothetical protein
MMLNGRWLPEYFSPEDVGAFWRVFFRKMRGVSMVIARQPLQCSKQCVRFRSGQRVTSLLSLIPLALFLALLNAGCGGQTAKPVVSPAAGQVDSYFGGPFATPGNVFGESLSSFDHVANQISVSSFLKTQTAQVPTGVLSGSFASADSGFLNITENFTTVSGVITPQNPPLGGAWAVEIPGSGVLANLLNVNSSSLSVGAAPVAMVENTTCPNFSNPFPFLYVTVPNANVAANTADYGTVLVSALGSAVTFNAQPFLIGLPPLPTSSVTGGCSTTNFGQLTAYPLNSFATLSNVELISVGRLGLLASSYLGGESGSSPGAFGGGAGVIGTAELNSPLDISAVVNTKYDGFLFSPLNKVQETYDITMLASAFGNHAATSPACSALQTSLVGNNGQGAGTVPVLPSFNTLYGGEFLVPMSTGTANNPTGANGSENCDVAIDFGPQDSTVNGLFPNATVFVGSNYPPFSASNPWLCSDTGSTCAVSFPAAAIVGSVQGRFVIFVTASTLSSPPARLPDAFGGRPAQPLGIYLFQKP